MREVARRVCSTGAARPLPVAIVADCHARGSANGSKQKTRQMLAGLWFDRWMSQR
jgi:hypothetical protein